MRWSLLLGGTAVAHGFNAQQVALHKKVIKRAVLKGGWVEIIDPSTQRAVQLFLSPGVAIGFISQL